jgi:hypothetical protein
MVLTVSFGLSSVTGLSCHRRLRKLPLADLTPASGRQDHTTSPSAGRRRSSPTSPASIASRTQRRDDAQRPSWWARDKWNLSLIWGSDQGRRPAANWHDGQITPFGAASTPSLSTCILCRTPHIVGERAI